MARERYEPFKDDFSRMSSEWIVAAGAVAVSEGMLRASRLDAWGAPLFWEDFTLGVDNWTAVNDAELNAVDFEVAPRIFSRGRDTAGLEIVNAGVEDEHGIATQDAVDILPDVTYILQAWAYAPRTNKTRGAAGIDMDGLDVVRVPKDGGWFPLETCGVPESGTINLYCWGDVEDDVVYFDAVRVWQANAVALVAGMQDVEITAGIQMPAVEKTPRSIILNAFGPDDYLEIRITPNLDEELDDLDEELDDLDEELDDLDEELDDLDEELDDLEVYLMAEGTSSLLDSAHIGWTPGRLEDVRVIRAEDSVNIWVRFSGSAEWELALAVVLDGETAPYGPYHGVGLWGTEPAFTSFEVK